MKLYSYYSLNSKCLGEKFMKVATLIDLMRSREIDVNELDYQDFAHIEISM